MTMTGPEVGTLKTVLVANRGEIARRVIRTCRERGIRAIAVFSDADADALHVAEADDAVHIGAAAPAESYLNIERIIDAATSSGADAVHPGYGFLSENASFARAVLDAGLLWIGPDPSTIELMGDKVNARNRMSAAGVPVAAGFEEPIATLGEAISAARQVGYPLMLKAVAGGGGIGMAVVEAEAGLEAAFDNVTSRGHRFFGTPEILLERYLPNARHVEVQVLGLATGGVVAVGERDCSVQRRHQKLVEETPSPGLAQDVRDRLIAAAARAAEAVEYLGAGTVEFLVFEREGEQDFAFLEMNTRLQVEHPITEMTTGIDLVAEQLLAASGRPPAFDPQHLRPRGAALEFRIYAEDPVRFLPRPGTLSAWREPTGKHVRVDSGYRAGDTVSPHYDPLLAKLCVWGATRREAITRARSALEQFHVEGTQTNIPFFLRLLENQRFVSGDYDTGLVMLMNASR